MSFPSSLRAALFKRQEESSLRTLSYNEGLIDFCSNDYLGFARNADLKQLAQEKEKIYGSNNGSTGSRLISGTTKAIENLEQKIAAFHNTESALIYNSGYDANIGLLSCIGKKNDVFLYDELSHASLIDGIRLSHAAHYKFRHNDVADLKRLLENNKNAATVYVVLESVYSMDGHCAPLQEIVALKKEFFFELIVDEAHATGIFGESGRGLCNQFQLENHCFARIYTFGKALGCHGALVAGSNELRSYLINFSRSFIYTTALSPHAYATIDASYQLLEKSAATTDLKQQIKSFKQLIKGKNVLLSDSAIQGILIPGNTAVSDASAYLKRKGLDVRAIKSPTVKTGGERLRICLHAYNTPEDLQSLYTALHDLGHIL